MARKRSILGTSLFLFLAIFRATPVSPQQSSQKDCINACQPADVVCQAACLNPSDQQGCLEKCEPADVVCQAGCVDLGSFSGSSESVLSCISACDSADVTSYSQCRDRCISNALATAGSNTSPTRAASTPSASAASSVPLTVTVTSPSTSDGPSRTSSDGSRDITAGDDIVAPPETSPADSRSNSPPESSGPPVGAIVGGTIGGLVAIAIILFLAWLLVRERRKKAHEAAVMGEYKAPPVPPPAPVGGYPAPEPNATVGGIGSVDVGGIEDNNRQWRP